MPDQGKPTTSTLVNSAAAAALTSEGIPSDLHAATFAALHTSAKTHSDAATMASLPLWTAAHHVTSPHYRSGSPAALASVLTLLPRVGDSRCYVTDARLPAAAAKAHLAHFEGLAAALRHPLVDPAVVEAELAAAMATAGPVTKDVGDAATKDPTPPAVMRDFVRVLRATNSAASLQSSLTAAADNRPPAQEIAVLRALSQTLRRCMARMAVAGDGQRLTVMDTIPSNCTIFTVETLAHVLTVLLSALHAAAASNPAALDVAREQVEALAAAAREPQWRATRLAMLTRTLGTVAACGVAVLNVSGDALSIDSAVASALVATTPSSSAVLSDKVLDALAGAAMPAAKGLAHGASDVAAEEDEDDNDGPPPPQWRTMQDRAASRLETVAQEVDFSNESAHARDLDALTRTIRDAFLAPPRDTAPFNAELIERILFDRRRGTGAGNAAVGQKRSRARAAEPKAILPVVSSLSSVLGDSARSDSADLTPLERIVMSVSKTV